MACPRPRQAFLSCLTPLLNARTLPHQTPAVRVTAELASNVFTCARFLGGRWHVFVIHLQGRTCPSDFHAIAHAACFVSHRDAKNARCTGRKYSRVVERDAARR